MQVSDLFANKKQRSVPLLSLPRWRTMSQSGRSFAPQIVLWLRFWAGQRTLLLWAPPATAIDGRWWFMQDYNAEHQIPSDLWSSLLDGNVIPCGRKTTVVGLSLTFACNGGFELEEMRRADRRMGTDVPRSVAPPSLPASSFYDLHKSYRNVTFIKMFSKICCDHPWGMLSWTLNFWLLGSLPGYLTWYFTVSPPRRISLDWTCCQFKERFPTCRKYIFGHPAANGEQTWLWKVLRYFEKLPRYFEKLPRYYGQEFRWDVFASQPEY